MSAPVATRWECCDCQAAGELVDGEHGHLEGNDRCTRVALIATRSYADLLAAHQTEVSGD